MLKTPPRLAQDSRENPLLCPQWQSREAGSCTGAMRSNNPTRDLHAAKSFRFSELVLS
jgi:hypothetical protein